MISPYKKEICNFCSRHIMIGQNFGECESCDAILHKKCFKLSEFQAIHGKIYCKFCTNVIKENEVRYNPFVFKSYNDNDKLYNEGPCDIVDSIGKISTILEQCSSYSICDFNKKYEEIKSNTLEQFSTLFINVDGNHSNFDNFVAEIESMGNKFSIIGLAETNTDSCNKDLHLINNYTSCYQNKNPSKHKGSGVAIYVHNDLSFVVNEKLHSRTANLESIFVDITNTSNPITVGTIYRPPSGNQTQFINELNHLIKLIPKNKKAFLMGDYNMDLHNIENTYTADYEQSIITSGFAPLISIFTHEKPNCRKTCIDNIFTNEFDDIILTGTISDRISHHLPVFQISYEKIEKTIKCNKNYNVQYYDY